MVAQQVKDPMQPLRMLGLTHWAKGLVLPQTAVQVADVSQILNCCGGDVGWQLQLQFDTQPSNFHMPKKKNHSKQYPVRVPRGESSAYKRSGLSINQFISKFLEFDYCEMIISRLAVFVALSIQSHAHSFFMLFPECLLGATLCQVLL